MTKKIIITWDLDGFVGALNSTLPYNYNFDFIQIELDKYDVVYNC